MDPSITMPYLFGAFVAVWVILAIYLYSIHSRERKLRGEVSRLKRTFEEGRGARDPQV